MKKHHIGIILCQDLDSTREIKEDKEKFLRAVTRFELSADIQRVDGIFDTIVFDNLLPEEINLDGEWEFEIIGSYELLRKLLSL